MAGFFPIETYAQGAPIELLPIRFEPTEAGRYLVTNMVGEGLFLARDELERLVDLDVRPGDGLYERAYSKMLIRRADQVAPLQLLAMRLRSRMSFLAEPTGLHIFVVTLRCEHSCPYCQVSRQSTDRAQFDMSEETAFKALDIALSSPPKAIKIEFQGGEPLLNVELIEKMVLEAKARGGHKQLEFVIATNLALLDERVLAFCKAHNVLLSTSLDGPADLHNKNRPRPGGNSHELAVKGIRRAQEVLGKDRVGALMTTTEASLNRVEEIVDEYLRLELDSIFLRPLSPYGFAIKTKQFTRYDPSRWLAFYERGLRYILEVNRRGRFFPESYAQLLLQRMLTDKATGYVDLRSPAGIGLGAMIYNYDGKVFASDEGRMLAETGDRTFEIGDVRTDDYRSIIMSDRLVGAVAESLSMTAPECHSCAYEQSCGSDPVYHHATQGDFVGIKPLSGFCTRQKGIFGLLYRLLDGSPQDSAILRSWVR